MTPNQVTLLRVLMGFAAVALFARNFWCDLAALALTIAAITLDALDGHLARRRNLSTPLGAQLDILGDRVVENLFFTFFAVTGLVSLWVPVLFFVRGMSTDFLRSLAARAGLTGFGANSMLRTWWGRTLVASRASRAAYGAMKCLCFCYLGVELTLVRLPRRRPSRQCGSRGFAAPQKPWSSRRLPSALFAPSLFSGKAGASSPHLRPRPKPLRPARNEPRRQNRCFLRPRWHVAARAIA